MSIDLTGLVRPHTVEMTKQDGNPNVAEFRLQPLERGYGHTLGNALRRLLLSSLRGSAVWAFRMDGVVHEHQTVTGVLEDVHQIVQRLKDGSGAGGDCSYVLAIERRDRSVTEIGRNLRLETPSASERVGEMRRRGGIAESRRRRE